VVVCNDDIVRLYIEPAYREVHRSEQDALRDAGCVAFDEYLVVLESREMALDNIVDSGRLLDQLGREYLGRFAGV
jgi:hypothetical protein